IRSGELSGGLDTALRRAADYQERAHALTESIKSALIYPAILLVTAGLSITFILTTVLPEFKPMFAEAGPAPPLPTRILMPAGEAGAGARGGGGGGGGVGLGGVARWGRDRRYRPAEALPSAAEPAAALGWHAAAPADAG